MATPIGPLFAAGNQIITKSGYRVSYWPDAHNQLLQQAGLAPIYYWLPEQVTLAKRDNGDYKFSMVHFVGVRSNTTNVGETSSDDEVAGGLLTFSTTAAPPSDVLQEAHDDLTALVRGSGDPLWVYTSNQKPQFTFIPIVDNNCVLSNTLPGDNGSVPTSASGGTGAPAPGTTTTTSAPGQPTKALNRSAPPAIITARSAPPLSMRRAMPRSVPRSYRGSNIDPMLVKLDGQGKGTIDPGAEKAFSALLGSIPAAVVYAGFHAGTGPLFVTENMMVRVVSPMMTIDIQGDWDRIQDHFSAAASGSYLWFSASIQEQFDSLRESGDITVNTFVDTSLPGADKLQEYMDKRSDLVFNKFMDLAKQVIFDPAPFQEQAAQAHDGSIFGGLGELFGGSLGVGMKLRQQRTHLHLEYHETKEMAYLQPYQVNGTLDGIGDAIKADPTKEKVYFVEVDLGDWDRKVSRIVKPVVNWPDPAQKWIGEPVAFLSVQTGYPNAQGALEWDGHVFGSADGPGAQWNTAVAMKQTTDVTNPPAGWAPDKMFLKRQIHFTEPPSDLENPYARVQVEKNIVDLDPTDLGTADNNITVEVRVEEAGTLAVGPILLGATLTDDTQYVEVTVQALGNRDDGQPRDPVKFSFKAGDQDQPRYYLLYTGQKDFVPKYQYSVRVVVKGTLFTHGQEWSTNTPIVGGGSGPLMISVPTPDDPNVTKKDVPLSAMAAATASSTTSAKPHGVVPPPKTPQRSAPIAPPAPVTFTSYEPAKTPA